MVARCAIRFVAWAMLACVASPARSAEQDLPEPLGEGPFELHGQATYVRQFKPAFPAEYTGPKSLSPDKANSWSFTGTLFIGARLSDTLELYVNPEAAAGVPFSDLQGVAAFTNAELARTSGPTLKAYFARAFVRKTWNLGGEMQPEPSAQNQLAMSYAAERVVLTVGLVSVLDIFGRIDYSGDPRTQFLNWSSTAYGAWDFPADARGYTGGAALEYISPAFSVRAGWFAGPKESNGLSLSYSLGTFYGSVVELEVPTELGGRPGSVQLLAFRNRANMGNFNDAIALGRDTGSVPDLTLVRRPQTKWGFGLTVAAGTRRQSRRVRAGRVERRADRDLHVHRDRPVSRGGRPRRTAGRGGAHATAQASQSTGTCSAARTASTSNSAGRASSSVTGA